MRPNVHTPLGFSLIFIFSFLAFITHLAFTKTSLYSDTRFYYAYTRSITFDNDINLSNDFRLLGIEPAENASGYAINTYPPGISILWMPLFEITRGATLLTTTIFLQNLTGLEIQFQVANAISSIFLGTFGLCLIFRMLREFFSEKISKLATFAVFASTNLFFYIGLEPLTSHSASFFVAALFLYFFLKYQKDRYFYFVLGLLAGFAGLVRTQDSLIISIPILHAFLKFRKSLNSLAASYLLLSTGLLIGFLPQIFLWKIFFGFFFPPPGWGYSFSFLNPQIGHVLFNLENGLFTITPVIFLSLTGLLTLKNNLLRLYSLSYFLIQLYLVSSGQIFSQGGSFGIRMVLTTYPFLSLGTASFFSKTRRLFGTKISLSIVLFLTMLNFVLIFRYLYLN
jgi:hypothetical protein